MKVGFTITFKRVVLSDDAAIAGFTKILLAGARAELEKASEGRAYRVDEVRIVMGPAQWEVETSDIVGALIEVTAEIVEEGGGHLTPPIDNVLTIG